LHLSRKLLGSLFCTALLVVFSFAQTETATVSGRVTDPQSALLVGAEVVVTNTETNATLHQTTNKNGLYVISGLRPGHYRISVSSPGFRTVNLTDLVLNVQEALSQNFTLQLGSVSESVTVVAEHGGVNTESAAVSTVVDRKFAEDLPMNGRSFQTLIELTPGVTLTVSNNMDNGQFSVNGQRAASNYWTVDGVSANVGISTTNQTGNGLSGAVPSLSVLGGTNSMVSVDAMQEFRIQTSTYAPEFGRTPGGQISIVTRSGTNQYHGSLFNYVRNDALDASDWFNGFTNRSPLPKAEERQNDFGGTLGGPIIRNRTFFFFSYEGLRLRLPQVAKTVVPDLSARESALPSIQPYLRAFPFDLNQPELGNGLAQFNASFSNRATLNAYGLRIDHKLNSKLTLFGRYSNSPSELIQRGGPFGNVLSDVTPSISDLQTGTVGIAWNISPWWMNDLRMNYSRSNGRSYGYIDTFGGAAPPTSLPFPAAFTSKDAGLWFLPLSIGGPLAIGPNGDNKQRQLNFVDSLSVQKGAHNLKFGTDFRRLAPLYGNPLYQQFAYFLDVPSAEKGNLFVGYTTSTRVATLLFRNLGSFAQDTWRIHPRLTLTYGFRWDVDFAPSSNPAFLAVTGFNLSDLSGLSIAPAGTPPYSTAYGNLAPRIGGAYQLFASENWQTVVRGGIGAFYDLASSEAGNLAYYFYYPFGVLNVVSSNSFPFSPAAAAPPPINSGNLASVGGYAFDPHLKLPYTLQWNAALEQSLGQQQTVSASYVGARGRRLLQTTSVNNPNANFAYAQLVTNSATSDFDSLQLQFRRPLTHSLQVLASYTWSHSIDDASAGSLAGNAANDLLAGSVNQNRGPSDFDVRSAFSAGATYDIAASRSGAVFNSILRGWSVESFVVARSALPLSVYNSSLFAINEKDAAQIRPDVVPGQPFYLHGSQCRMAAPGGLGQPCPGGRGLNVNAFTYNTPGFIVNGVPTRQGNLERNGVRGFRAAQWDFAIHRDLPIHADIRLQFRAEMFNVLNHPNFAPPISDLSNTSQFGVSTQTLGNYLSGGNVGRGGLSPLYQVGGARSIQLALKLVF
jgi:hypothetical protein